MNSVLLGNRMLDFYEGELIISGNSPNFTSFLTAAACRGCYSIMRVRLWLS